MCAWCSQRQLTRVLEIDRPRRNQLVDDQVLWIADVKFEVMKADDYLSRECLFLERQPRQAEIDRHSGRPMHQQKHLRALGKRQGVVDARLDVIFRGDGKNLLRRDAPARGRCIDIVCCTNMAVNNHRQATDEHGGTGKGREQCRDRTQRLLVRSDPRPVIERALPEDAATCAGPPRHQRRARAAVARCLDRDFSQRQSAKARPPEKSQGLAWTRT